MVVYVEYAFLENFLFDGALICLAFCASKAPLRRWRIVFAAACGGFFALLYPILTLPVWGGLTLKISVGFLLCLIAFGRVKTKKEWGRYALSCFLFFFLTFAFGGGLVALQTAFSLSSLSQLVIVGGFFPFEPSHKRFDCKDLSKTPFTRLYLPLQSARERQNENGVRLFRQRQPRLQKRLARVLCFGGYFLRAVWG